MRVAGAWWYMAGRSETRVTAHVNRGHRHRQILHPLIVTYLPLKHAFKAGSGATGDAGIVSSAIIHHMIESMISSLNYPATLFLRQ